VLSGFSGPGGGPVIRLRLLGAAACVVLLSSACTAAPRAAVPPATASPTARSLLYVAVGASESVGVGSTDPQHDAWPEVLYRTALPRSATFVNLAVPGSTVAEALQDQVPRAVALAPRLVTVWLNVNDILHGVPATAYQGQLLSLVTALRRGGATTVLVANTPPLDQLPAYQACLAGHPLPGEAFACSLRLPSPAEIDAVVAAYNAATAQVVSQTGAILVHLHAAGLAAERNGTEASLVSPDGFHPSDAGYALVARSFAAALAASGFHA
jgi:acyl-CoA thioesterase-1